MKKNSIIFVIISFSLSMCIGAGGTYLKYKDSIEYGNKYPVVIETYDFMKDAETPMPENVNDDVQINSFLKLYDDKYTFYSNPDMNSKDVNVEFVNSSSTAVGCGFKIDIDEKDNLFFSEVCKDMPAYEQGFRTGDRLLSIDNNNIETYKDVKKLCGKNSTCSEILIERDGKELVLKLKRINDKAEAQGIVSNKYDDILYVTLPEMNGLIIPTFLEELEKYEYSSIIIDLRENPGGDVSAATSVADVFINKAEVRLMYYLGGVMPYTTEDGVLYDMPVVLLVNGNTASSAEILTALLKQYADTTIVGTTTYGKGIFQGSGFFKNGILQYTQGYVEVGEWECYHGKGIDPDIEIEMDSSLIGTDEDIQLQKALELLRGK